MGKRFERRVVYKKIDVPWEFRHICFYCGKFSKAIVKHAQIAKSRLEWEHWPISIDGNILEKSEEGYMIKMDGKEFKRLDHAIEYVKRVYKIPALYFEKVINVVGYVKADPALAVCRTRKVKSEAEMNKVLEDIIESERECVFTAN